MMTIMIVAWIKVEHKVKKLNKKLLKLKMMMMVDQFNLNVKYLIQECIKLYNGSSR